MPLDSKLTEEQLFDSLITSIVHSVWVSIGKIKNPMTDKIERNLFAASMNIDMLDMLYKRMDGNLNEQEETYLSRILSELKMNYLEEKEKGEELPKNNEAKKPEKVEKKLDKKPTKAKPKAKKSTLKPKEKK